MEEIQFKKEFLYVRSLIGWKLLLSDDPESSMMGLGKINLQETYIYMKEKKKSVSLVTLYLFIYFLR